MKGDQMPKQKENTCRINVFIAPDMLEKLKLEASEKGTTVSGLIRMLLIDHTKTKPDKE